MKVLESEKQRNRQTLHFLIEKARVIPIEAFSGFRNVLWVFFHEVGSDSQHALSDKLPPVELFHVEEEKLFVLVVKLLVKILQ